MLKLKLNDAMTDKMLLDGTEQNALKKIFLPGSKNKTSKFSER